MINHGFPEEFIEEVKEKNDIVSVMSKSLTLNRKGRTYWTCCPFHFEKTPSMAINENEQYYHCFGCGESGDVIKFVQKYENVSFYEAVKMLAQEAGIPIPEIKTNSKDIEKLKQKEKALLSSNLAKDYYKSCLPKSKVAINYLKGRGITGEIAKQFQIGYSPDWQGLINFLQSKNIDRETMVNAGLIDRSESGRDYDVFATRLIFPILNAFGDCIGFTARSLESNPKFAKYRNSTQSLIFDKSRTIYNIFGIKELKKQQNIENIIICEGTIDVIAMYKAGIKNAVACMGTAITELHAKELKRYSDKIILCLDGDGAGQNATYKAIDVLIGAGLEVRVAFLRDNLDPDELLKKYGEEELKKSLLNTLDAYEYKIETLSKRFNLNDNYGKNKFVSEALKVVQNLSTYSQREIYLKIISHKSGIAVDILRKDLPNNYQKTQNSQELSKGVNATLETNLCANEKAIRFVLASLIHKKNYAKVLLENNFVFINKDYQKLYDYVKTAINSGRNYTISNLYNNAFLNENENLLNIINYSFEEFKGNEEEYFKECLNNITSVDLEKRQQELLQMLKEEKSNEKRREIVREIEKITKEMKGNGKR